MDQEPEQLRREIESTRQSMASTLDAIGDHVNPSRIVERRKNRMLDSISSVRNRVMGAASTSGPLPSTSADDGGVVDAARNIPGSVADRTQGSPLGAGLVAFGLGFVAAAVFPATAKEKEMTGQLMDKAQPLADELKAVGQDVADQLKGPAQDSMASVRDAATTGVDEVKSTVSDAMPGQDTPSSSVTVPGDPLAPPSTPAL